jgi:hypothetical protein
MQESKEDAQLREELIASIMHSIKIINNNAKQLKEDDEKL